MTIRQAAETLLEGMRDGSIRNRSGDHFKPSTIRRYEIALRIHVIPELGALRLVDVRRANLQSLVEQMSGSGADASTIRNAVMPLRVIYRRAVLRDEVAVNPTGGLALPAVRGRRERIASPAEAVDLLQALSVEDRALWAIAIYAGLRAGEIQALDWSCVDLASGVLRVERSWDEPSRTMIDPKTPSSRRSVPIAAALRDQLAEHRMLTARDHGLVCGRTSDQPFAGTSVHQRARRVWTAAGMSPIGLHECRHTYASLMIAAGVNAKALSTYMGHASITTTYNKYGHLMPGNEAEAAALLDTYLERANTAARLAALA